MSKPACIGALLAVAWLGGCVAGPPAPPPAMTEAQIELVRRQIAKCWSIPAAVYREGSDIVVAVVVEMNRDATVQSAVVADKARLSEPLYKAAAESALRTVLNPRCSPWPLPADRYESWKTLVIDFNPKAMAGQ